MSEDIVSRFEERIAVPLSIHRPVVEERDALRAENERLTRQADYLANDRDGYVKLLTDENNKLRAKNERLRAALERAAQRLAASNLSHYSHEARAELEETSE